MAKSKKKVNKKGLSSNTNISGEFKRIIIMSVIVLVCFGLFYLLTVAILGRDSSNKNTDNKDEVEIQNEEILVGSSFNNQGEYLVLYYDTSDEDNSSVLSALVSTYRSKEDGLDLYISDLSDGFNKSYVTSDESNPSALSASELKLKSPTLIRFVDGKIEEYIENLDSIKNYLN